jgi:hypothetical protein
MLGLFRKASAGPVRQNNPQQPSSGGTLDLSQRPYTRALLRTAEAAADSIREEAARAGFDLGETRPDQTDADGMIAYAVRLVTVHITLTALEQLNSSVFILHAVCRTTRQHLWRISRSSQSPFARA